MPSRSGALSDVRGAVDRGDAGTVLSTEEFVEHLRSAPGPD
jgi:hypothetical protein